MKIRQEIPDDYPAVYTVIQAAFAAAAHSDGTEQDLVQALRASPQFVPALSLVAEQDGQVIGHILFSRVDIGGQAALALAPLAVLPAFQRQGVGSALVRAGHRIAAGLGYGYAVVLGSETYYPRFGYRPAGAFGIAAPFAAPPENFMAIRLRDDAPAVHGVVRYDPAFGI